MSHIVTITTKIHDAAAVVAACQRLQLVAPLHGTARLYSTEVSGLLVQLPEWQYPIVIDTLSGSIHYDNFNGSWGDQGQFDRFMQAYAVEKTKLESRRQGYQVTESLLQNGSIKLHIHGA